MPKKLGNRVAPDTEVLIQELYPNRLKTSDSHSVTILCANAYLVPGIFAVGPLKTCKDQRRRANHLSLLVKEFDAVCLQEHFGSQHHLLESEIGTTHTMWKKTKSKKWLCVTPLKQTVNAYKFGRFGGLWSCWRKELQMQFASSHVYQLQNTVESLVNPKRVTYTLLDMEHKWGAGYKLLLINTHLFSGPVKNMTGGVFGATGLPDEVYDEVRREQICEVLTTLSTYAGLWPKSIPDFNWARCGVLFMGDFNLVASENISSEYAMSMRLIKGRDLYVERRPNTEGHASEPTYEPSRNEYIDDEEMPGRIDFIIAMDNVPYPNQKIRDRKWRTTPALRLSAEDFAVLKQEKGYTLSDHWPICATVRPSAFPTTAPDTIKVPSPVSKSPRNSMASAMGTIEEEASMQPHGDDDSGSGQEGSRPVENSADPPPSADQDTVGGNGYEKQGDGHEQSQETQESGQEGAE